jgi:hypothetical protein
VRVKLADGTERVFIQRGRLRELLDLGDEQTFIRARDLLVEVGLLTPHRRSSRPARGYVLPLGWEHQHVPHLKRRVRVLLWEAGERQTEGAYARIIAF